MSRSIETGARRKTGAFAALQSVADQPNLGISLSLSLSFFCLESALLRSVSFCRFYDLVEHFLFLLRYKLVIISAERLWMTIDLFVDLMHNMTSWNTISLVWNSSLRNWKTCLESSNALARERERERIVVCREVIVFRRQALHWPWAAETTVEQDNQGNFRTWTIHCQMRHIDCHHFV